MPDLGEGLQEAEVVEWHVKPGDTVKVDQKLVSVETAKAIVEIPSPCDATIAEVFGKEGDFLHVGEPLIEFVDDGSDAGTVVGKIEGNADKKHQHTDDFIIGGTGNISNASPAPQSSQRAALRDPNAGRKSPSATPAVRALAQRLEVDINSVHGSGPNGLITAKDIESAHELDRKHGPAQLLRGTRRTMAKTMELAHSEVVPVSLHDDANIQHWTSKDTTIRMCRAIARACKKEPNLNAWYDGNAMSLRTISTVDIGIAVDTPDGLFVPVLRNVGERSEDHLREGLNCLREDVKNRTIPAEEMTHSTISLSNFGTIGGRYANPIVVPPAVAIVGTGAFFNQVVLNEEGHAENHRMLPLSLTFDHRCITGGEASRFLQAIIDDLNLPE
nr:dihydrolipoamide acetyltransferase family protein [Marinibactrum halimedae]